MGIHVDSDSIAKAITSSAVSRSVVVNSKALTAWRAALASRSTTQATILAVGDSITEGYSATTRADKWTNRLQQQLAARYPVPAGNPAGGMWYPAWAAAAPDVAPTLGGTSSNQFYAGPGLSSVLWSSSSGSTITFTVQGTSCKVWLVCPPTLGSLNATWSVDGGATTGFTVPQQAGTTLLQGRTIPLGASGSHTVAIAYTGGFGHLQVAGVDVYDGEETVGVHVINGGHVTTTAKIWVDNDNLNAPGQSWMQASAALANPDLVLINLGVNDYLSGTTDAQTYMRNIQTIIAKHRLGAPNASYALVANYETDPNSSGAHPILPWSAYVNALYNLIAVDPTVALIDLTKFMPQTFAASTYGLYLGDNVHPNTIGNQMMADILTDALGLRAS